MHRIGAFSGVRSAMSNGEVIVIGGGITGCATAYELGKHGVHVTILEREHIHAMGSGWTLAGVRQSGRLRPELPIAREAIRRWETLGEELDAEIHYRQNGNLRLALTPDEAETIRQVVADGNENGVKMEWLDGAQARELAPALVDSVVGASFCPTDGHADNIRTVQAYADAARRQGASIVSGVEVLQIATSGDRVTGVITTDGTYTADAVVLAAGIYSPKLLTPLGLSLPIFITQTPVAETVPTTEMNLSPVLGVAAGNFAARQTAEGGIRFIGRGEMWNEAEPHSQATVGMTVDAMDSMTHQAIAILPALANIRVDRVWAGLIDKTPDVLPVLDAVPAYPGLVVGAGFSGHGFGIGPMSGEILANLTTKGTDDRFDLEPFRLDRFTSEGVNEVSLEMLG